MYQLLPQGLYSLPDNHNNFKYICPRDQWAWKWMGATYFSNIILLLPFGPVNGQCYFCVMYQGTYWWQRDKESKNLINLPEKCCLAQHWWVDFLISTEANPWNWITTSKFKMIGMLKDLLLPYSNRRNYICDHFEGVIYALICGWLSIYLVILSKIGSK